MSVDHLALMRSRLITQFRGLPNLDAFIHAIGAQLNDVEEFYGQLLNNLILQNAVGAQLDRLGVLLNQGRNSLSDTDYRTLLQARVVEYQASGTTEDLIQVLLAIAGATKVQALDKYPAGVQLTAIGQGTAVSTQDITAALLSTKSAGVRLSAGIVPAGKAFTYDLSDSLHGGYDVGHFPTVLV